MNIKHNYLVELKNLLNNSYPQFSNFTVAALAINRDKTIYSGVNIETLTMTASICAERNAIFNAISSGTKWGDIREIHITTGKNANGGFVAPCGICRQVIYEASNGEAKVYLYKLTGEVKVYPIKKLLPFPFDGNEIKR